MSKTPPKKTPAPATAAPRAPSSAAPRGAADTSSPDGVYSIVTAGADAPKLIEGKLHLVVEAATAAQIHAPDAKRFAHGYGRSVPGFSGAGIETIGGNVVVPAAGKKKAALRRTFILTPGLPGF